MKSYPLYVSIYLIFATDLKEVQIIVYIWFLKCLHILSRTFEMNVTFIISYTDPVYVSNYRLYPEYSTRCWRAPAAFCLDYALFSDARDVAVKARSSLLTTPISLFALRASRFSALRTCLTD
jgi:hypothetical protein